jgi:molybdate transport system substrate-binding protein
VITDPEGGGVSGVYIAEVFRRLGIAENLKPKLRLNRGGPNAAFVARGEADMAVQLGHEIRTVPGIEFIPLPAEFEKFFVFSAALASNAKEPDAAKAMLQVLSSPTAEDVIRAKGMEPVPGR